MCNFPVIVLVMLRQNFLHCRIEIWCWLVLLCSFLQRLKNWEARERKKTREYEKEREKEDERKAEEVSTHYTY